ncbi:MAG: substrate-binding domain-containing protein [Anaerolineales bacterium]|nr:MAG: substrate-binding domain-containing protein [Anaerolineales bacterium]
MNLSRTRVVFFLIMAFACVIVMVMAGVTFLGGSPVGLPSAGSDVPGTPLPQDAVVVEFHSSNTKQDWINEVVESFNAEGKTVADGRPIVVVAYHVGSGSSMNDILDGEILPTVWSPGSQLWVTRINQTWNDRTGRNLIQSECPATIRVPLAIAMWEPMARALGWPDALIGWNDLAALSNNPEGWGAYGHPEWGQFKFGHPHPEHSNSGMLSLVAEVYDAAEVTEGLTVERVKSETVAERVGAVERNVFHYGRTDTDILTRMTQRGPDYLHAVTSYESNVIKWNTDHAEELQFPLVAIYPSGGTFWVQNPYCILNADWVSPEQAEAAGIFRDYLLTPSQQARTVKWGLRPADESVALQSPIDLAHGAVPAITQKDVPHLPYPSDEIISHIIDTWHEVKKKATVVMLIDVSGSMKGTKIKQAVRGATLFIGQMDPADEIYVIVFSDEILELPYAGEVGSNAENLRLTIEGLYAGGGTALYQSVIHALERVDGLQAEHEAEGEQRIYGVVLLSDGLNEVAGGPSQADMLSRLPSGAEASSVKIYTIAYGKDADEDLMATLANRTNGKKFEGSEEDIESIYFLISSEF